MCRRIGKKRKEKREEKKGLWSHGNQRPTPLGSRGEAVQKRSAFHYCCIVPFLMLTQGVKKKKKCIAREENQTVSAALDGTGLLGLAVTCGFIPFLLGDVFPRVTLGGVGGVGQSGRVLLSSHGRLLSPTADTLFIPRWRRGGDPTGGCRNVTLLLEELEAVQHRAGAAELMDALRR